MPSPQLFEAFMKKCEEHGIRVTPLDDPMDTFMCVIMRCLDYIEESRMGIMIAKGTREEAEAMLKFGQQINLKK